MKPVPENPIKLGGNAEPREVDGVDLRPLCQRGNGMRCLWHQIENGRKQCIYCQRTKLMTDMDLLRQRHGVVLETPNGVAMKERTRAEAFNEWMRRYIETPEQFEREMAAVNAFLAQARVGREPDYGAQCAAYLEKLEAGE